MKDLVSTGCDHPSASVTGCLDPRTAGVVACVNGFIHSNMPCALMTSNQLDSNVERGTRHIRPFVAIPTVYIAMITDMPWVRTISSRDARPIRLVITYRSPPDAGVQTPYAFSTGQALSSQTIVYGEERIVRSDTEVQ